jgi:Osmosensitive K+ channel histidine kinase
MAAVLFLTIGLNGVLAGLADIGRYAGKSFVEATGIDPELGKLVQYLSFFELAPVTFEEAKRYIEVGREYIDWHKRQYGNAQMSDEEIRQMLAEEKEDELRRYFEDLNYLRTDYNRYRERYAFHFVETGTGRVYTNLESELQTYGSEEKAQEEMLFVLRFPDRVDGRLSVYQLPGFLPYQEEVAMAAADRPVKQFAGWIGVPKSDAFMAKYKAYRQHQGYTIGMLGVGAVLLILLIIAGSRLSPSGIGLAGGALSGVQTVWRNIPIDLRGILLLLTAYAVFNLHQEPILSYDRLMESDALLLIVETVYRLAVLAVLTAALALQLRFAHRSLKEPEPYADAWRKSLAVRLYGVVRDAFLSLRVGVQAVLLFFAVFGLGGMIFVIFAMLEYESPYPWVLPFAAVTAVVLYYVLRQAGYLNRLLAAARDDAAGRATGDVPVKGRSVIAELASHWNRMRRTAEASRANEAKSERLKTELITNVSHDLRTPLTSVISYVDLLKNPDLTEEERASYIAIIDQKSKRLKALIDDLFEATKMASGSVELNRERIDLGQLIEQALAESGAKDGAAGIEFRVKLPEQPVFAIVDGQKMWRVFDNLISNMIRYSLEGTRAYITLGRAGGKAEITFKNVAKYELGDNVDELIERFKRGDASRHTEGSGLGLAIAKSIVDLHGGTFALEVDGDLFKVKVTLPEA